MHSTDDPAEGDLLLAARRMALPALERLGSVLLDDVAVPRSRIAAFIDGCDAIATECGLVIGVLGHAGDGNMHPTIVFDPTDADQRARAFAAFDDILELGLSLGGTIAGEHGVGHPQARLAGARDRAGVAVGPPGDQGRAGPRRPAQPRQDLPHRRRRRPGRRRRGRRALTCRLAAADATLSP